jgi:uncharacterized Zn finger protein
MAAAKMTEREKLEGRLEAAKINGGASAAIPRGNDRYTVEGRAGARYTVQVFNLETMACDCKAGINGVACWHAAAVYLRIVADRAVAA